jgi:glycosyltransferase involved in cell wall biosynthesis
MKGYKIALIANSDSTFVRFRSGLISKLSAANFDVALLSLSKKRIDTTEKRSAKRVNHVEYLNANPSKKSILGTIKLLVQLLLWVKRNNADAYLVQNSATIILMGLAHFIFRLNVPMVVLVEGLGRGFDGFTKPFWKLALARASAVIFLNDDDPRILRNRRILDPLAIQYIMPGIGIELSKFPHVEIPLLEPNVLMIARLIKTKHPLDFCEAAKICKKNNINASFTLIYETQVGDQAVPERLVKKYSKYINLIKGPVDVREYLRQCSFICMPSENEGFPTVIMEAASTGRASLVSSHATLVETVNADTGWAFTLGDANELSQVISEIIETGSYIEKGKHAADFAKKNYDRSLRDQILFDAIAPQ